MLISELIQDADASPWLKTRLVKALAAENIHTTDELIAWLSADNWAASAKTPRIKLMRIPGLFGKSADFLLSLIQPSNVVHSAPQSTTEGVFAMPDHDEQELETLMDALRELAGRLDEDADKGLIEEAIKAVEALAELEAEENGEEESPEDASNI